MVFSYCGFSIKEEDLIIRKEWKMNYEVDLGLRIFLR